MENTTRYPMISKFVYTLRSTGVIAILILAGLLYLSSISHARLGFYHDDSIYVTAAKALATGQGYRFIGMPFDMAQTKYPIFYPFLLSIIWRALPQFPANVTLMMGLSVILTIAFLLVTYLYITNESYAGPGPALLIVLLIAINPAVQMLSVSILSDMLYATLSVAALWMVERLNSSRKVWLLTLSAGVTMGLSFLTRTIALSLISSVVLYLVINKEFKKAIIITVTTGCFVVPWFVWCQIQATKANSGPAFLPFYLDYVSFYREFIRDVGIFNVLAKDLLFLLFFAPMVCLAFESHRLLSMLSSISSMLFIGLNLFALIGGFIRHFLSGPRLAHIYVLSYTLILSAWPIPGIYERLLVPILPFLLLYLITELTRAIGLIKAKGLNAGRNKFVAIFPLLIWMVWLSIVIYNSLHAHLRITASKAAYSDQARREEDVFKWIRGHTNPSDVLICYRDQIYYLFTDRKAIRPVIVSINIKDLYTSRTPYPMRQEEYLFSMIKACKAQYLITDPDDFNLELSSTLLREKLRETIAKWPQIFVPVYSNSVNTIYRVNMDNKP